jgi:hypothetical protein
MANEQQQQPNLNPDAAEFRVNAENGGGMGSVKLSPFWPHSPGLWFAQAEGLFMVRGITDERAKYYNVVAVLPHESLRKVADIVEAPPEEQPYSTLKQRLMASHQLTGFQRAEKLLQMPALGSGKPSDLMAAMLEVCPRGEEKSEIFACLFLQRLPREIRILLSEVDHKDPKALAAQADRHWGLHESPAAVMPVVADLPEAGESVNAVRADRGGRGGRGGRGRRGRGGNGAAKQQLESDASMAARLASGLCLKHWRYGEQAHSCTAPCSWQGNAAAGGN